MILDEKKKVRFHEYIMRSGLFYAVVYLKFAKININKKCLIALIFTPLNMSTNSMSNQQNEVHFKEPLQLFCNFLKAKSPEHVDVQGFSAFLLWHRLELNQ